MLVFDMIYLNWIVKNEKSTGTFEMSFPCFGPFWVWGVTRLRKIDETIHFRIKTWGELTVNLQGNKSIIIK